MTEEVDKGILSAGVSSDVGESVERLTCHSAILIAIARLSRSDQLSTVLGLSVFWNTPSRVEKMEEPLKSSVWISSVTS